MSAPASTRLRLIPIAISQTCGIGCGVAGVKLNSSLIPPEVLGLYGLFLTCAPIGMWVVHAGLLKFTVRHWAGSPGRDVLLRTVVKMWARRLPWLAAGAIAAAFALSPKSPAGGALLALALFTSASLLAAGALIQTALQAESSHWKDCLVTISGSLSRTFAPPLLFATFGSIAALWLGFTLHTFIIVAAGSFALGAYWHVRASDRPRSPSIDSVYRGPLFTAMAIASWLLAGINRWIVAAVFGEAEAGYFTLIGGASVVLTSSLGAVFMQYFQPGIFKLGDDLAANRAALARRVDAIAVAYTVASIGGVMLLSFIAPWLVGPLINPKYQDALPWIIPAGNFGAATITTVFYQSMLLAARRERACAIVDLSSAIVLAGGCILAAAGGCFVYWLVVTPLVPWVLTRTLARRYFFQPDAAAASVPVP